MKSYDTKDEMWQHVTRWSHSMEVDYRTKDGKNILTKAYFPFDPKVASLSVCENVDVLFVIYNYFYGNVDT